MMGTYLMFGSYNHDSVKKISAQRTDETQELIKKNGGSIKEGYAMLGENDLLLVADFPDVSAAVKSSVELSKHLGISFSSSPALSIEEFDKLV